MIVLDDVLLFSVRGLLFIFHEIQDAAEQEKENEAEAIRTELTELYMMFETGRMTEAEFEAREKVLLDRLEKHQSDSAGPEETTQVEPNELR